MNKRKQWFKAQCQKQGICAEDLFVVGYYATNKEGDFLHAVTHEEGEDSMNCVLACDLTDYESSYAEWLFDLMEQLEESYRPEDMILTTCAEHDWREIALVFKECICRNKKFGKAWRDELRRKPAIGVFVPHYSVQIDWLRGKFLGLRNACQRMKNDDEEESTDVVLPPEFEGMGGYRFALKVVNMNEYLSIYSHISWKGQHKPFRILASLEEEVANDWKNEGRVRAVHHIDAYDSGLFPDEAWFKFSHFEVDNEIDEHYRTFYVCYTITFEM